MILVSQPIYTAAPFPSCHAATLVETPRAVLAAFFGGTGEGKPDASIWLAERVGESWSPPRLVADGVQPDGTRFPCWNPVLFRTLAGQVLLFYKVGPNPSKWWGVLKRSNDDGQTWSNAERFADGNVGPAKNKPVQLANGDILCPSSIEHESGWRVYFIRSTDGGRTFAAGGFLDQPDGLKATQPTILTHSPTTLQALGRTTSKQMFQTWSHDAGRTWSRVELIELPNCNSGLDAVTLRGGRHLLVYNHSNIEKVRYPLNVAVSDDGKLWQAAAVLEDEPPGQYSYPCVIQTRDGLVHIAYTWKRRHIHHVILDPARLLLQPIDTFVCPPPGSITHRVDPTQ